MKPAKPARNLLALSLLLLALLAAGLLGFLALAARPPAGIPAGGRLIVVQPGEGASVLASRLKREGALRSDFVFRVLAKVLGLEGALKAGTYRLEAGMDARSLLELIASGKQVLLRVTFPEGLTLSQTARIVEEAGLASSSDFLAAAHNPDLLAELGVPASSLEGYLFPDTYFLPLSYGAAPTARAMVAALKERLASIPEAAELSPSELHKKLVLASVIEREYRIADEAPVMASVFYNRLKIGMALQSCATVVYVLTEKLGKPHPEIIYERDTKIPDDYNTYMRPGLPPGPIASPGLTAIRASFYPVRSNYLYFRLVDAEAGRHHFSQSLDEHVGAASLAVKRVSGK